MTHEPYDPSEEPVWKGKRLRDWFNFTREGISIAESMSDEEYEILNIIGLIQNSCNDLVSDSRTVLAHMPELMGVNRKRHPGSFAKSGKQLAETGPENRRIDGDLARQGIHLRFIPADCVQCLPKQLFSLPFLGRQTIPTISRTMLIARANQTGRSIDIEVRTASPIGAVHIPNF